MFDKETLGLSCFKADLLNPGLLKIIVSCFQLFGEVSCPYFCFFKIELSWKLRFANYKR